MHAYVTNTRTYTYTYTCRQALPLLDGNKTASALIRVLSSKEALDRILSVGTRVRGKFARECWDAMAEIAGDRDACVERIRAELRLADWCMQVIWMFFFCI